VTFKESAFYFTDRTIRPSQETTSLANPLFSDLCTLHCGYTDGLGVERGSEEPQHIVLIGFGVN
jgi:hypothetical protein